MANPTVTLTGWKAVVAIVIVLGLAGFRWMTARDALNTQGRQELEQWVALELIRPMLADSTADMAAQAEAILGASEVRIASLAGRGPLDDMVVRVELEPGDHLPPGTELIRYYRMEYSSLTGWRWRADASAVSWHLALF